MRGRVIWRVYALIAIVLAASFTLPDLIHAQAGATTIHSLPTRPLPPRTLRAGDVTIKITPRQLTERRAVFAIAFDTHSTELDLDVVKAVELRVDGIEWPNGSYTGDGPGGHHREGVLRFPAGSPPQGPVRLTVDAFGDLVTARWRLPAGETP